METRKLYYEDCCLKEFTARVTGCEEAKGGWAVTLDATAFYPEGGGQAPDKGTLNGIAVLDVQEKGESVTHLCEAPLPVGTTVTGCIDWPYRFDRMQQHTGEHIVSGIVHRRFGYHNVGFHMGSELVTIDFDGMLTAEDLISIEQEANEWVWQNLPVKCWYPSQETLPSVPYRSKREIPWPVRIVQVAGVDSCACCGIHVPFTGQVGLVKLFSCVKFHQGVRIEMACGGWALAQLNRAWEQNRQVSQAFSAKVFETGEAARKMNEALAAEKYRSAGLQSRLFARMAEDCRGKGDVLCLLPAMTPAQLRELAEAIGKVCGGTAALFSGTDRRYDVCLAHPGGDVKPLGQQMAKALQGRGGGKAGFFQGFVDARAEEIENFFGSFWRFEL